jgi:3',5'-cyclic AMP phosphodiesterase CpdA
MPKLLWITDPHFNFIPGSQFFAFMERVSAEKPDAVLIGGDIGEAPDLRIFLDMMDDSLECPIYFVLGNHDFYRGSIDSIRRQMKEVCLRSQRLVYLPVADVISLSSETALIGHDGWADGRFGDYDGSSVLLNDYLLIEELVEFEAPARRAILNELGDEAAAHLRRVLPIALQSHRQVILLTHVPPFREACWHQGQISNDEWLPHMACKAVGDAIEPIMRQHPDKELLVLCGHTHSGGEAQILPNLRVITGAAVYRAPAIGKVWEVE